MPRSTRPNCSGSPANGIGNGAPELMQPSPGRFVAAQAQHPLQAQRARPVLLAREPPHGSKPTLEGLAGVLKYCARRWRSLMPAAGALQQRCPHRPRFVVPASRTTKTLRPAELTQILSTGLLGGETRLELGQIPRIIFHFPDPTSCGHLSQVNTHLIFLHGRGRFRSRPRPLLRSGPLLGNRISFFQSTPNRNPRPPPAAPRAAAGSRTESRKKNSACRAALR